jgi:hypothetical protein
MLNGSEFILSRVVVEALGYFISSLDLFYTCFIPSCRGQLEPGRGQCKIWVCKLKV